MTVDLKREHDLLVLHYAAKSMREIVLAFRAKKRLGIRQREDLSAAERSLADIHDAAERIAHGHG